MISQYLLSQQPIKVTRSKNPNFREMRLCMAADSGVRLLWSPYFAHWSSARWNKLWCPSKVVYSPGIHLQGRFNECCPILDVFCFIEQIIQLNRQGMYLGPKNWYKSSAWARGQDDFVSRRSDGKNFWVFLNFCCGCIF